MMAAKIVSGIGVVAMTIAIVYGFVVGNFNAEGAQLLSMPWGIVSLVDLYTGFALFAMWIPFREQSLLRSLVWVVLLLVLGFFIGALYTFFALQTSGGNWNRFFMGRRLADV